MKEQLKILKKHILTGTSHMIPLLWPAVSFFLWQSC